MITVKTLKKLLELYPDDAQLNAYEGEGVGLNVKHGNQFAWISASTDKTEDEQRPSDLPLRDPS